MSSGGSPPGTIPSCWRCEDRPRLITGNPIIVKPSPLTPVATLRLGELAQQILPPGVLQVLSGGDDLGRAMTAHTGIDKITFTGSERAGKSIMAAPARPSSA